MAKQKKVSCCSSSEIKEEINISCCDESNRFDFLYWGSVLAVIIFYTAAATNSLENIVWFKTFSTTVYELFNEMWWGLILGIFFIGVMNVIPKEFFIKVLGSQKGMKGLLRATFAGLMLDLCNHGILMIAAKLYERGARVSQVVAFLIASPWNSFSLTVILWSLIGWQLTLCFIVFSMIIALITGMIFERLLEKNVLPKNPHYIEVPDNITAREILKNAYLTKKPSFRGFLQLAKQSILESKMILKWILIGTLLAGLVRTFVPTDIFATYFGASLIGLLATLVAATVIEVCSEGSVPIASELVTRAGAAGNAFTFLMAGASTDYTEIMILREATKSWKIPLFLPLVTVPQIVVIGYLMNNYFLY
ncbi:MAG: permease [Alphaproteobacteria bacterium]